MSKKKRALILPRLRPRLKSKYGETAFINYTTGDEQGAMQKEDKA